MAPPGPGKAVARKRNRKRKRRAVSSSSSVDDSSSGESGAPVKPSVVKQAPPAVTPDADSSSEDESSESSSSESSDDDDEEEGNERGRSPMAATTQTTRARAPSESPAPATIPPFLSDGNTDAMNEQALREKFRKFWMASVADGFKDDLEQIRKEPNMSTSRLALLIDSLASGADVFTSSTQPGTNDINEMEVVTGNST